MRISLQYHRILLVIGILVIPVYGYALSRSGDLLPLYLTLSLSFVCLTTLVATFVSASVRKNIRYYAFSIYLLISLHDLFLFYRSGLDMEFFLSFLVGLLVLSTLIETLPLLKIYYTSVLSAFVLITLLTPVPAEEAANKLLYMATVFSTAIIIYIVLYNRHLTENRLAEKTDELNRFIYQSSHDLRGPVTTILGLVKVADKLKKQEDFPRYFSMIATCANRLDTILRSLIEIKSEQDDMIMIKEVCFEEHIRQVIRRVSGEMFLDGISFKVNVKQERKYIANTRLINIILNNIIENAIVHNPHTALEVAVDVREKGDHIYIQVGDNGAGIKAGKEAQVFDMFYRLSGSSGGFGLGLYMVKDAVEKLRGKISVNNDKGARFTIQLPISSP